MDQKPIKTDSEDLRTLSAEQLRARVKALREAVAEHLAELDRRRATEAEANEGGPAG
jgi:ribosomal protein L29